MQPAGRPPRSVGAALAGFCGCRRRAFLAAFCVLAGFAVLAATTGSVGSGCSWRRFAGTRAFGTCFTGAIFLLAGLEVSLVPARAFQPEAACRDHFNQR